MNEACRNAIVDSIRRTLCANPGKSVTANNIYSAVRRDCSSAGLCASVDRWHLDVVWIRNYLIEQGLLKRKRNGWVSTGDFCTRTFAHDAQLRPDLHMSQALQAKVLCTNPAPVACPLNRPILEHLSHSDLPLDHAPDDGSHPDVRRRVLAALFRLEQKDGDLLHMITETRGQNRESAASERAMAHRLAVQLENLFFKMFSTDCEWNVDCEYNRSWLESSEVHIPKTLSENPENSENPRIIPDIIIHKRGSSTNLLVIEVKPWCSLSQVTAVEAIGDDWLKLAALTRLSGPYKYRQGLFLMIRTGRSMDQDSKYPLYRGCWWTNGQPKTTTTPSS